MNEQVIDDRDDGWFRHVMDAIEHARGDRRAVSDLISSEILGEDEASFRPDRNGRH
ncbi:MAG TPA: hypothetical protein PLK99_03735 [Burkholderiales bacterium]|nr:hypothetical protein [Burkholderiales bacterium]